MTNITQEKINELLEIRKAIESQQQRREYFMNSFNPHQPSIDFTYKEVERLSEKLNKITELLYEEIGYSETIRYLKDDLHNL